MVREIMENSAGLFRHIYVSVNPTSHEDISEVRQVMAQCMAALPRVLLSNGSTAIDTLDELERLSEDLSAWKYRVELEIHLEHEQL